MRPEARQARFDERVFAEAERLAIARSREPEALRWKLWAAKESAFKAARRLAPGTFFSPSGTRVVLESDDTGMVVCGGRRFAVRVSERAGAMHAIARTPGSLPGSIVSGVEWLPPGARDGGGPSRAVRTLAVAAIATRLGISARRIRVVSERRIPRVAVDGRLAPIALSLSHHGRLVAFAFLHTSTSLPPPRPANVPSLSTRGSRQGRTSAEDLP